jgi:nucleotide-binding universal stress UspA family protein
MKHVRKILAPVDLTKNSLIGLKFAVALAKENQADLLALYVANEYQAWQMSDETGFASDRIYRWEVDRVMRESMLDLHRFLESSLGDSMSKSTIMRKIVLGDAVTKIIDVAIAEESDLIVLSPRRRGALGRFFFGSVTDKVTRLAPCPVLSVAAAERPRTPRGKEAPALRQLRHGVEFS